MKSPAHAHAAAIASAVVAVAVASGFWLLRVDQGGVKDLSEGWLPAAILLLAAAWLVIRVLLEHRIQWRVITVIIVAFAVSMSFGFCIGRPATFKYARRRTWASSVTLVEADASAWTVPTKRPPTEASLIAAI